MGQLFSSEEELSQAKAAIGALIYDVMVEGGAVPELGVVHPLLLANHDESFDSPAGLQEQLQQLQGDLGNRAPTYLRDLIGRLSTFSDEPRLAGLVGLVVTMVMDMIYTSSKRTSGAKGKSAGSSSAQRVWELQEVMEEYLKRCRIHLSDRSKLTQDATRLEAQLSLTLTQLKTCLLGGDCDSRSLRHWASGAAFHTQMLLQLAALEGKSEPNAATAALEQYKEDLSQIIPAYRRHKWKTVCVVKCRGDLLASCGEVPDEGSMTGLTVTDSETGKSVTIPLAAMEAETGRRGVSGPANLDIITSDQYAQAYLDHFFSHKGPVAELESYFLKASDKLKRRRTQPGCKGEAAARNETEQKDGVQLTNRAGGVNEEQTAGKDGEAGRRSEEAEKLSIMETQSDENLDQSRHGGTNE